MINYTELDRFFIGTAMLVITNAGGIFTELGEDIQSIFYKLDEEHYADVNRKGVVAQVVKEGSVVTSSYVLQEDSLRPVIGKNDILSNTSAIKRLSFKPSNYKIR